MGFFKRFSMRHDLGIQITVLYIIFVGLMVVGTLFMVSLKFMNNRDEMKS